MGVALLAQLGAASPSPDPGSYLADAPSFSWVEEVRSTDVLEGKFSAADYAAYIQAGTASPNSVAANLTSLGFVRGFGREWGQVRTQDYLVERVFQFRDATGSRTWFRNIQAESENSSAYLGELPAASAIPNAFGVRMKLRNGDTQWRIDFVKDDLVFVVHADAAGDDMSSLAVGQATAIYKRATGSGGTRPAASVSSPPSWIGAAIVGMAVLVAIALTAAFAAAVMFARGRARTPALASAVPMSPDGNYWWDGASWRDAGVEVPPGAQRSPDGAYWWDGQAWRRVVA